MNDDAVRAVLAEYGAPWGSPSAATASISGGFSGAGVWKIEVHGRCAALRRWPVQYPRARLERLHELLSLLRARGCEFAPQPLAARSGGRVVEFGRALWDLCDWIQGAPDDGPEVKLRRIRSAVACLRRTHALAPDPDLARLALALDPGEASRAFSEGRAAPSPGALRRWTEWNRLRRLPLGVADPADDPDRLGPRSLDLAAREEAWMSHLDCLVKSPLPTALCWRDAHRGNVLFRGDQVAGVVDYGAIGVDAPAADYGRLLGSWLPNRPDLWPSILGDAADGPRGAERLARLSWRFHRSGLVVAMLHWREWLLLERRPFADPFAAYARWRWIVETLESMPVEDDDAGRGRGRTSP